MTPKNMKIQPSIAGGNQSKIKRYQQLVIGSERLSELILFELIVCCVSWLPGALGLFLRSKLYPLILGEVGKGTVFGTNIVFRHPKKIFLGEQVIIDDNVMLDAKGDDNHGIRIKDEGYIGRNSILS